MEDSERTAMARMDENRSLVSVPWGLCSNAPKSLGAVSSHTCTAGGSQSNVSSLSRERGSKGARTETGREGG